LFNKKASLGGSTMVFSACDDGSICGVAPSIEEATERIEADFKYVIGECDGGGRFFQKRK
jgi:hypothetical protein